MFYSWQQDLIDKNGNDLNENAFISEHCDLIIGRASGPFAFSQTQNNMIKVIAIYKPVLFCIRGCA